jgi:glycosyltransferase 2 family protein
MRGIVAIAAKAAISGLLLWLALARVDWFAVGERLRQIDAWWSAMVMVALLVQLVLFALRWRQITLRSTAGFTVHQAVRFSLIAMFFNQTLPSTFGGDAARIWLLSRTGAGWKAATYSVLIDRLVGLLVLAVIIVLSLPWALALIPNVAGRVSLSFLAFGCLTGVMVFVLAGAYDLPWMDRWWPTRHFMGAAKLAQEILRTYPTNVATIILSMAIHGLTITAVWFIAKSVAAPIGYGAIFLLFPPVLLISTVPISIGGWGVRESATMVAFSFAGLAQVDGLIISVLFGIASFLIGTMGGAVWIGYSGRTTLIPANRDVPVQ